MTTPPIISIIVPNYNHANFLDQRLESIFSQTFQDYEVIVLDDCSSDHSKKVIEGYRNHPKFSKVIFNEVNSGSTFKQWERGINVAFGEFIWIAESDDFSEKNFLSCSMEYLHNNENVVLSFCRSNVIDEQGNSSDLFGSKIVPNEQMHSFFNDSSKIIDGNQLITDCFYETNYFFNSSAVIFRKKPALLYLSSIQNMKLSGDWLLWIKLLQNNKVAYIHKNLNYFRKHSNTVRGNAENYSAPILEYFPIAEYLIKNFSLKQKAMGRILFLYFNRFYNKNPLHFFDTIKFLFFVIINGYFLLFIKGILKERYASISK